MARQKAAWGEKFEKVKQARQAKALMAMCIVWYYHPFGCPWIRHESTGASYGGPERLHESWEPQPMKGPSRLDYC